MTSVPRPPPDDPVPVIAAWLAEAATLGGRNPNSMALATVDSGNRPSARMVLLKELAPLGYAVFFTNYGSRKALELEATNRAAAVLHWDALGRQVRVEGPVVRSPGTESDAYFANRPWRSQVNAWVSEQSRPLTDPAQLEQRVAVKAAELGVRVDGDSPTPGARLPRPTFWGGYRLWFETVELWTEGVDRFHERYHYRRDLTTADAHAFRSGRWHWQRLQP